MRVLDSLRDLLATCEEAGRGGACEVTVVSRAGQAPLGRVYIDDGRLVWARTAAPIDAGSRASVAVAEDDQQPFDPSRLDPLVVRASRLEQVATALAGLAVAIADDQARVAPAKLLKNGTALRGAGVAPLELIERALAVSPRLAGEVPPLPAVFREGAAKVDLSCCYVVAGKAVGTPVAHAGTIESSSRLMELSLQEHGRLFRAARCGPANPLFNLERITPHAIMVRGSSRGWLVALAPPYLCLFRLTAPGDYGTLLSLLEPRRAERFGRAAPQDVREPEVPSTVGV